MTRLLEDPDQIRYTLPMGLSAHTGHAIVLDSDVCDEEPDNVTLTKYTWGLDLSGSLQGAGGVGGLLACEETADSAYEGEYWFLHDANGNVVQLIDASTPTSPTLAAHYEYDPYGNTIVVDDVDQSGYANDNPFRFSTKWLDKELAAESQTGAIGETGLCYYGYRYYSPSLGRWIKRDPIGERGGWNLYATAKNDAVNKFDRLGLETKTCEVCCGRTIFTGGAGAGSPMSRTEYGITRWECSALDLYGKDYACKAAHYSFVAPMSKCKGDGGGGGNPGNSDCPGSGSDCTMSCLAASAGAVGCGAAITTAALVCKGATSKGLPGIIACGASVAGALATCTAAFIAGADCIECLSNCDEPSCEEELENMQKEIEDLEKRIQDIEDSFSFE